MKELSKQELLETEGGSLSVGAILAITGGIIFLIGVMDGYTKPLTCN